MRPRLETGRCEGGRALSSRVSRDDTRRPSGVHALNLDDAISFSYGFSCPFGTAAIFGRISGCPRWLRGSVAESSPFYPADASYSRHCDRYVCVWS